MNNEAVQELHPIRFDQHVHVKHFAEFPSQVLFEEDVMGLLLLRLGTPADLEDDKGRARYASMPDLLRRCRITANAGSRMTENDIMVLITAAENNEIQEE